MIHLITGGSGSGKSAYGEAEAVRLANAGEIELKKYYIATMEPFGEETRKRIQRHRRMRAGKGFETIECYVDLAAAAEKLGGAKKSSYKETEWPGGKPVVLLECMSNLVANERYRPDGAKERTVEQILQGVERLEKCCEHVVIVTNEVCSECAEDSADMQEYKRVLSEINCALARKADRVTEVVYGIPVEVKR